MNTTEAYNSIKLIGLNQIMKGEGSDEEKIAAMQAMFPKLDEKK